MIYHMAYLHGHLATLVMGVFSAILTGLWPIFVDFAEILNIVFLMAVPIAWFLTAALYVSQLSANYMKHHGEEYAEKKSLSSHGTTQIYTSDGRLVSATELKEAKTELSGNLYELRDTVKLKDSEIERLKEQISTLETRVQIESLKAELANLKAQASETSTKRKSRK